MKVKILQFSTTFTQVYTRPKKKLLGSSLAFTLEEGPVRCAKVCNKSWVILRLSYATAVTTVDSEGYEAVKTKVTQQPSSVHLPFPVGFDIMIKKRLPFFVSEN